MKKVFDSLKKYIIKVANWIVRPIISPTPKGKLRWTSFALILLTVVGAAYAYPQGWNTAAGTINTWLDKTPATQWISIPQLSEENFRLGLDLQGGAHLVYQADLSAIPAGEDGEAMEGVRDVIERRVNFLGIAEPLVQISGENRLIVELAGVFDIGEAIKNIGETPLLEFKEQNEEADRELTEEEQAQLDADNEARRSEMQGLVRQLRDGNVSFEEFVELHSEDPATKDNGGNMGWVNTTTNDIRYSEVADDLIIGRVSDVFEAATGFAIIRVNDKRQAPQVELSHLLICYEGATACESGLSKEAALEKIQGIKSDATPENFAELVKENTTEPGGVEREGNLGFISPGVTVPTFDEAAFALAVDTISDPVETEFGYHLIWKRSEREITEYNIDQIYKRMVLASDILGPKEPWLNTGLSGKHLDRADVQFDQTTGEVYVGLVFNDEGRNLFAEITERNIDKPVAIFLDGQPISIPRVSQIITAGEAVITGNFHIDEAKDLARRLNAGALPVPINLLSQQTVGAKLGAESLNDSLEAALWGLALVALLMMIIYRFRGFVAVLALFVYGAVMLGFFKLIGVTLTLAGIAGFILSLGMAVDANVLIFERMKEEMAAGKPFNSALDEGFRRAWPSIRDGNISTLITCFILMQFGTSIVKGFAITLGIGVLISMFSAMIVTKNFMQLLNWKK